MTYFKIGVALLFIMVNISARCQNKKIDSLRALLPANTSNDSIKIFGELSYEYGAISRYREGLMCAKREYRVTCAKKDSFAMVSSARRIAFMYRKQEFYDSALRIELKAIQWARKFALKKDERLMLLGLALNYTWRARYDSGLYYNFALYSAAQRDQDDYSIYASLNNIGLIYYKLEDFKKAIRYFERCSDFKKGLDEEASLGITYLNISLCYSHLKQLQSSRKFLNKASKYFSPDDDYMNCQYQFDRAVYYRFCNSLDSAIIMYKEALRLCSKIGNKKYAIAAFIDLSEISFENGNLIDSRRYLDDAENALASTSFNYEALTLYKRFIDLYKKLGRKDKLVDYLDKYVELKDSIYSLAYLNSLVKIENDFLERGKNAEIEAKREIIEAKDNVISRQWQFGLMLVSLALILSLLLYLSFRSYKNKKIANRLLDQKVLQRTHELLLNQLALEQTLHKRDKKLKRGLDSLRKTLLTMKGLEAVSIDLSIQRPLKHCVDELTRAMEQIIHIDVEHDKTEKSYGNE